METKYEPWDVFFKGLETGDIILMQGLFVSSIFTEILTGSHWSHAATVIISDDIGLTTVPSGTVLLWESNIKNDADNPNNLEVTDVILGGTKDGPILDHLKQRITNNFTLKDDNDVAKRKLNFPRSAEMFNALKSVINDVHLYGFPAIPFGELTHFVEGKFANVAVTDHTFMCSQLVAHNYKAMALLNNIWVDNSYSPADFSEKGKTILLGGATLGPEIRLDLSTIPPYPGY